MDAVTFLRQYRVGPFAIFDFAASFIAAYLLSPLITWACAKIGIKMSLSSILWLTVPVSVLVHILVGRHTPLTKMVLDVNGYYGVKLVIAVMVYMGVREAFGTLFKL